LFYEWAIAVPKETTEAAPVTQVMQLTEGVITGIEVQFPKGCAGLTHCRIRQGGTQKWPTPPSDSFTSDGHAVVIDENYELSAGLYELVAVCWNDDDTYQHTIYVRVGVLRGQVAIMILKVFQGLEKMLRVMGIK
jgi:hypothetical protein